MANGGIIGTVNNPTSTTATGVWQQEEQYEAVRDGTWPQRALFTTKSLRFNSGSSDYLNRTPGSTGNRKTFTMSFWVKRSKLSSNANIFSATNNAGGSNERFYVLFGSGDTLSIKQYDGSNTNFDLTTNRVFRDSSAWYHIVYNFDSSNGTADNRQRIWVNGVEETSFSSRVNPSLNYDSFVNQTKPQNIGNDTNVSSRFFGGYMAEFIFVDGQALAPTSFGVANSDGVWTPIIYTGTYGTNGFNLQFENSAALGTDSSPNGNTFTVNNLTSIDQSTDYPVVNYATLNPLNTTANGTEPTYSEGNLQSASPSSGGGYVGSSTISVTNGKWFWEFKKSGGSATNIYNGIGNVLGTAEIARNSAVGVYYGNQVFYRPDGTKQIVTNGSNANSSYGSSWTTNDIIGIALDLDSSTNTVTFYKNGASQGAINLPVNTDTWFFIVACGTDTVDTWQLNFGSPSFAISSGNADGNGYGNFEYAVPSGFYAINTANLGEFG